MSDIKMEGIVKAKSSDVKMNKPPTFAEEMKGKHWSWNVAFTKDGKYKVTSPNSPGRQWIVTPEEFEEVTGTDVIRGL